jgi:peptide methionine sulfoxide reductase MsrA
MLSRFFSMHDLMPISSALTAPLTHPHSIPQPPLYQPSAPSSSPLIAAITLSHTCSQISVEKMLSRFFSMHAPMPRAFTGTQYRSAIFYHDQVRHIARSFMLHH